VFWPRRPKVDHVADIATHGMWGRFAAALGRHPRRRWVAGTVLLLIFAAGLTTLKTGGLTVTDSFTTTPDAVHGQRIFDSNFDQGNGAPANITATTESTDAVLAAVAGVPGVDNATGSVCVATDFTKVAALVKSGQIPDLTACAPPALQVAPVNGRVLIDANLRDRYDTTAATDTVKRIRTAVHAIPGANALVGGATAVNYDTQQASRHDRNLIIPIVLVVILLVLGLVLRAILAPLVLIASVVLSFAAALGVSAVVFNHVFHFANADPAFPLFAFVFLVALGIDYNIFLMTRVREETLVHGTRSGILRGLAVTGGVITSAGVVLAATFTVLGVLPIVFLAELGFAVAFGVLLDTILVRSIVVPALSHDIGKRIWWPSKLAVTAD
jgi:RND superfamily putative drug exporter